MGLVPRSHDLAPPTRPRLARFASHRAKVAMAPRCDRSATRCATKTWAPLDSLKRDSALSAAWAPRGPPPCLPRLDALWSFSLERDIGQTPTTSLLSPYSAPYTHWALLPSFVSHRSPVSCFQKQSRRTPRANKHAPLCGRGPRAAPQRPRGVLRRLHHDAHRTLSADTYCADARENTSPRPD